MRSAALIVVILACLVTIASAADDSAAPLVKRLVHNQESIRSAALAELGALPDKERLKMAPQAIAALATSHRWVDVLYAIGPVALPDVLAAVRSENPRIRSGALEVLARWPDHTVATIPLISAALNDGVWISRRWAVQSIGKLGPAAAPLLPELIKRINDREREYLEEIIKDIGLMGSAGAPATKTLVGLLSASWMGDDHRRIQGVILGTLPRLNPAAADILPDAIPFLGDPALIHEAISCLEPYGNAAIPYLVAATEHPNARVRAAAVERLWTYESPEAKAAIARYQAAEPSRLARSAAEEATRSWTRDEIRAPLPQAADCWEAATLSAESEFDLEGHGVLLVTAHVTQCFERPGALRIWRRDGVGYRLVLRSDDEVDGSTYAFTMTTLANQWLLHISSFAHGAYRLDRFFVVGDDATLTEVSFTPPESGCGSWLPIIGQEEYAGLKIRADDNTLRFGFGDTDFRPRGTLVLTHSSGGAPQLRVATCQTGLQGDPR